MRTKEAEEREVQERTWIYLLHDQAPPTAARHVTPAVLAARSAGVMGGDAAPSPLLLPSVFAPTQPPIMLTSTQTPFATAAHPRDAFALSTSSTTPTNAGAFDGVDAFGRPLARDYALPYGAGYAPRVVTANDKWHVPQQQQQQQQQLPPPLSSRPLAPLRSILVKSEKAPVYVPVVVPGPMVMKRDPAQQQMQQAPSLSPAVVAPSQKKSAATKGLLPKKRRLDEMNDQYSAEAAAAAAAAANDADEDDESKLSKRNCFPKKCDFPMCKNSSRSRGFCYSHGGGRRCRMDGCNNGAVSRDLCKRHGGGRRCRISGCKSSSESGGLCYSHGGGRRCSLSWCSARAKKGGYCAVHIDNKNAEPPSPEELAAQQQQQQEEETKAAVPPNVVETLLSLAQAKSSSASLVSEEAAAISSSVPAMTAGSVSPTSPTLPELSTPRFSSIASLLN